jgi:hypothetical protein
VEIVAGAGGLARAPAVFQIGVRQLAQHGVAEGSPCREVLADGRPLAALPGILEALGEPFQLDGLLARKPRQVSEADPHGCLGDCDDGRLTRPV